MRARAFSVVAAAVLAVAGAAHGATEGRPMTAQERMLVDVRNEVAAQATLAGKGAAQQSFEMERRRLDDLIDRMEAGQRVSPSEVDAAIGAAQTAP
jgi:hypothetical protein